MTLWLLIGGYVVVGFLTGRWWATCEYYNTGFAYEDRNSTDYRYGPHGMPKTVFVLGFLFWWVGLLVWLTKRVPRRLFLGKPPAEHEKRRLARLAEEYEREREAA